MKHMSIDIETYSHFDLARSGVYKYVESPDFDILLFSYAYDGADVATIDLARGEKMPEELIQALLSDVVIKWAFNAQFERICLSEWLKRQGYGLESPMPFGSSTETRRYLDPVSWRCSMTWSAYLGLPFSLEQVGSVLGLKRQKLKEGKELIRFFSIPCKPSIANGARTRNRPEHDLDKWHAYIAYNKQDVLAERAVQERLSNFPLPESEWTHYIRDQEINDHGILIDQALAKSAMCMDQKLREKVTTELKGITALNNPNSISQLKDWLASQAVETESLDKKSVKALLERAPEKVKEVLKGRQALAKSSVKKYQAMMDCVCEDGRARGLLLFYGANRTGRFAGRLIQVQNLPRNKMDDLDLARTLVKRGDLDTLDLLFDTVPQVLSELIRTAFVPAGGRVFLVADYSAIEARVLAWLAGETWRMKLFESGGDIYCQSASEMFGVTVEKHGEHAHLRQKGKISELACIAEGELVLTDQGLVPIECVTTSQLLWDGETWVQHEGVINQGKREIIEYEGLKATAEHLVFVEGKSEPIQFGIAAASGAHLLQTGDGWRAIRLGENHQSRETLEQSDEPLLCTHSVHGLRFYPMAKPQCINLRKVKRVSTVFSTQTNPQMAGSTAHRSKTALCKSQRSQLQKLWCKRDRMEVSLHNRSGSLDFAKCRVCISGTGTRPYQHRWTLRKRKYSFCSKNGQSEQQEKRCLDSLGTEVLALFSKYCLSKTERWHKQEHDYPDGRTGRSPTQKELENHRSKTRVYDIRNAGRHHRFTVSGRLVHNCGYGGSVGALKAMGALEMGLLEEELPALVSAWRSSNPNIVKLWYAVDRAAKTAIKEQRKIAVKQLDIECQNGMLIITLPSKRQLFYVKPRIGENRFGGESITYEGVGTAKRWERMETYGAKLVENIVQAISRDLLCVALQTFKHCDIVMHVHDEIVIEADPRMSLHEVCRQMSLTPTWAKGLRLDADGFSSDFYKKD